jgi:hypothetical protein
MALERKSLLAKDLVAGSAALRGLKALLSAARRDGPIQNLPFDVFEGMQSRFSHGAIELRPRCAGPTDALLGLRLTEEANRAEERRRERIMSTILPFLRTGEDVFDPKDIAAMATALDDVCRILSLNDDSSARETVAVRIIDLAKAGERNPARLRDRVLREASMAGRVALNGGSVGIK